MQPTLVVLAAGLGSRFGSLKQMQPLGPHGEVVLDYAVWDALRAGFGRVVFVLREDFAAAFQDRIGNAFSRHIAVDYAFQDMASLPPGRSKPWGTAHALLAARSLLNGPFAVINADDFYGRNAFVQMAQFLGGLAADSAPHCAMVGYAVAQTLSPHGGVNRGICLAQDGVLQAVEEHTQIALAADGVLRGRNLAGQAVALAPNALASMNFWGFTPAVLPLLEAQFANFLHQHGSHLTAECYIPTVVNQLVGQGLADCRILPGGGDWFGMTYPQDLPMCVDRLQSLVAQGVYPARLW
jgi:hypothetical protein